MSVTRLSESRTVPVPPEETFNRLLPLALSEVFVRRHGPIPPVRETREQPPTWGAVGQSRRIVLSDGGTMLETLTSVAPPRSFGYTLSELTGPLARLIEWIEGQWSVDPVGTGSRVTWSWEVQPRGRLGRVAMPLFARLWRGYARQSLEQVERLLLR